MKPNAKLTNAEHDYSGITEQIEKFIKLAREAPDCPHCGSTDIRTVIHGVIGRTILISTFSKLIALRPNTPRAHKLLCQSCEKTFAPIAP